MTSTMPRRLSALLLAGALVLTACSEDEPAPEETAPSAGAEAPEEPVPAEEETLPAGVTTTAQGTDLAIGESATVSWEPRADLVGVLDVTVDAIGRARMKEFAGWQLDEETRASTPYFVISTLRNAGEDDLGGLAVPLFVGADSGVLIQASEFQSEQFRACPSGPFPEEFLAGEELTICQVYLLPEGSDLANITFRPTQDFDPIEWSGEPVAWGKVPRRTKSAVGSQLRAKEQAARKTEQQATKRDRRNQQDGQDGAGPDGGEPDGTAEESAD